MAEILDCEKPTLRIQATATVERGWRNTECNGWDLVTMVTPPVP